MLKKLLKVKIFASLCHPLRLWVMLEVTAVIYHLLLVIIRLVCCCLLYQLYPGLMMRLLQRLHLHLRRPSVFTLKLSRSCPHSTKPVLNFHFSSNYLAAGKLIKQKTLIKHSLLQSLLTLIKVGRERRQGQTTLRCDFWLAKQTFLFSM